MIRFTFLYISGPDIFRTPIMPTVDITIISNSLTSLNKYLVPYFKAVLIYMCILAIDWNSLTLFEECSRQLRRTKETLVSSNAELHSGK